MSQASKDYLEQQEYEEPIPDWEQNLPSKLTIVPGTILTLSKESAETFHNKMKDLIYTTGYGLFEYLETIQFFTKLKDAIHGKDGNEGDREFVSYVRDEIKKNGEKEKLTTAKGVKFENAEVGVKYDFSNDAVWCQLDTDVKTAIERRKEREEFLKTLKSPLQQLMHDEVVDVYPPLKTSKSSFKVTLAK